jgi:hypothetical protein
MRYVSASRSPVRRHAARLVVALLAAAVLLAPLRARADVSAAEPEGLGKLLAYLGCAFSIVMAHDVASATGAFLTCAKTFHDELKPEREG